MFSLRMMNSQNINLHIVTASGKILF